MTDRPAPLWNVSDLEVALDPRRKINPFSAEGSQNIGKPRNKSHIVYTEFLNLKKYSFKHVKEC